MFFQVFTKGISFANINSLAESFAAFLKLVTLFKIGVVKRVTVEINPLIVFLK